jgi:GNAT superfamily N-acetyltransferase
MITYKRTLAWENFIHRDQIMADPGFTTMVIRYNMGRVRDERLSHFEKWSVGEGSPKIVRVTSVGAEDLQVELSSETNRKKVRELLIDQVGSSVMLKAEVRHGNRFFKLDGAEGQGEVRVGNGDVIGWPDHSPYKFYEFRQNGTIVAKALIGHCEKYLKTAPAIELLEVAKEHQLRRIGTKIVELIEDEARADGFERIWANNISRAVDFWERLDYKEVRGDGTKAI